jgi:hypothetical protein
LDNLLANIRDDTDPGTVATVTLAASDGTELVAAHGGTITLDASPTRARRSLSRSL